MEKKDRQLELMQLKIQIMEATSAASQAASAAQLIAERVNNSPQRLASTSVDDIKKLSIEIAEMRSELAAERTGSFASQKLSQEVAEMRGELHASRNRSDASRKFANSSANTELHNRIAILQAKLTAEKEYREAFESVITSMDKKTHDGDLVNAGANEHEDAYTSDRYSIDTSVFSEGAFEESPAKAASVLSERSDHQRQAKRSDLLPPSSGKKYAENKRKASLSAPLNPLNAIHTAFALIDNNADGEISRIEVIKSLRKNKSVRSLLGLGIVRQEDGSRDRFEHIFQSMDRDMSRSIDRDEFTRFFERLSQEERTIKTSDFIRKRRLSHRLSESKSQANASRVAPGILEPMDEEETDEVISGFPPASRKPATRGRLNTADILLGNRGIREDIRVKDAADDADVLVVVVDDDDDDDDERTGGA